MAAGDRHHLAAEPVPFIPPSSPEGDGWIVLHCAHATSTARFNNNSIGIVCALREHEG